MAARRASVPRTRTTFLAGLSRRPTLRFPHCLRRARFTNALERRSNDRSKATAHAKAHQGHPTLGRSRPEAGHEACGRQLHKAVWPTVGMDAPRVRRSNVLRAHALPASSQMAHARKSVAPASIDETEDPCQAPPGASGRVRKRLPVAANIALASAGATGGVPGSPPPPRRAPLFMILTLIDGASSIRTTG